MSFTVNTTTPFVFRLATDYATQAAIIEPNQLSAFTSGQAFSGYGLFNNATGYKTVTLAAGNYYIGVRNAGAGANAIRYELDRLQRLTNGAFEDNYRTTATSLSPGQRRWDPFTIQSGVRYWIDGCNSGLDAFVIDASELASFQSGGSFYQYTDYGGVNEPNVYGGVELELNPGSYYLVQLNPTTTPKAINYVLERWTGLPALTLAASVPPGEPLPDAPQAAEGLPDDVSGGMACHASFVGSGCGVEHDAVPAITASGHSIGLRVTVDGGQGGALAALVIGLDANAPVPLDIDRGCWLHPTPHVVVLTELSSAGAAVVTVPGPADSQALPPLILQWIVVGRVATSSPSVATSGAIRTTL